MAKKKVSKASKSKKKDKVELAVVDAFDVEYNDVLMRLEDLYDELQVQGVYSLDPTDFTKSINDMIKEHKQRIKELKRMRRKMCKDGFVNFVKLIYKRIKGFLVRK